MTPPPLLSEVAAPACQARDDVLQVRIDNQVLLVLRDRRVVLKLALAALDDGYACRRQSPPCVDADALMAALEALCTGNPAVRQIRLRGDDWLAQRTQLLQRGVALEQGEDLVVEPAMLWQVPQGWLSQPQAAFPQAYRDSAGRRHPLRPPKPVGQVYTRFIPWLAQTLSLRVATVEQDLPRLHRWMNDPRVAEFFQEAGTLAQHADYLAARARDPHMTPLIGAFDDVPFGYFEIYWASENRLGPHYDAHDYDRGWHVLVGEDAFRGRQWIGAWLPSLMHYLFLDEPRTQRIVGEPQADHHRQIANLEKSGFTRIKDFDFPHKRATLVMLSREHYFGNRLWAPANAAKGGSR